MTLKVLSEKQVEDFIERGWTKLEQGFSPSDALAAQDYVWKQLQKRGVGKNDKATWTHPMVHLAEVYDGPEFQVCNTEHLADAIEDLIGEGRWKNRTENPYWGWWPVNFPQGADAMWDVPTVGWHWDGQHFRHSVDSPHQGLLLLCCFSKVEPRGGGTLIASGSHKIVARLLAEYPEGVEHPEALYRCIRSHPWLSDLGGLSVETFDGSPRERRTERFMDQVWTDENGIALRVEEVLCDPGDVFLSHPFLYHSASANLTGEPRFMCNRTTPLKEPMQLDRPDGAYSPLEESVRRALQHSLINAA